MCCGSGFEDKDPQVCSHVLPMNNETYRCRDQDQYNGSSAVVLYNEGPAWMTHDLISDWTNAVNITALDPNAVAANMSAVVPQELQLGSLSPNFTAAKVAVIETQNATSSEEGSSNCDNAAEACEEGGEQEQSEPENQSPECIEVCRNGPQRDCEGVCAAYSNTPSD